ncbi:MAG: hypothetical protein AB1736_11945 [Chloroflexota bacterium]
MTAGESAPGPGPGRSPEATPGAGELLGRTPDREPVLVGLSPRQVVGGFAFVAAIILWLIRRSRRRD